MRRMSKSAQRVAREALAVGRAALPLYGSPETVGISVFGAVRCR
jgi:hypothetical protein